MCSSDLVAVPPGSTACIVVEELQAGGEKVGLCKIKCFRPFPVETLQRTLGGAGRVAVLDRNCSFGPGGIFAQEIRAALCPLERRPPVYSYIAGLGGRDITPDTVREVLRLTRETDTPPAESRWIGRASCRERV